MVSKARAPDAAAALARGGVRLALTASLVGAMLVASGCPARQQQIVITTSGAQWLLSACKETCSIRVEEDGGLPGTPPVCPASCGLPDRLPPDLAHQASQARLFLVTPGLMPTDAVIRDASKCMTLPALNRGGARSLADDINQQLDGAIANGLGFDGLQNASDVVLFMAFYQQQDFLEDTEESQPTCRRVDLVACAGLTPPLGGGDYDMSCASCQDGSKNPQSRDNGPCPKDTGSCFLERCDTWLATNGYD